MNTYTVQTWDGEERVHEDICGLSVDAAREVATTHMLLFGFIGRVISETSDYMEVYDSKNGIRRGTHAQTTLVHI